MNAEIIVLGSLNMDLIVKAERAPEAGETLSGHFFQTIPGGKGANQAAAAAKLGGDVAMVGRVGDDDFGARLTSALCDVGVDASAVKIDPAQSTGIAMITVDDAGENRILVVAGANGQVSKADVDTLRPALAHAKALVLQMEIPLETIEYVLNVAAKLDLLTFLNLAPAYPISDEMLRKIDYLILNESEACLLTNISVTDQDSAKAACSALFARGAHTVIITLGGKGALLATMDEFTFLPAYQVDVVDTTAAGDAFSAGFVVSLLETQDLARSVQYANAVGALTVTKLGAQVSLPSKDDVENFLKAQSER